MWAALANRWLSMRFTHESNVGPLWDIAAFSPRPHIRCRLPHTAHIPRTACWLQCGQLLARHLNPLLERAVAHHLALYFVHAVDHGRVVAAAERLPDFD